MAFNLTAGNPRAHRIRVYYFGTSTVYEGMPVCYDNSTTNWFGGSVSRAQGTAGEITAASTTAEGSQNEGKYIRVENVNADNISLFAGVVAKGKNVGKAGPAAVDIFVPNGAVVPVRTDSNCLIDQTILAITTASQELGVPLATDSRPVAIARETVDRGTAGLVLAELNPGKFLHQDMGGTALSVDDADTTTSTLINSSNISFLGSASYNRVLYMIGELSGGGGGLNGMFKFRTYVNSTLTSLAQVVCANLHVKDDGVLIYGSGEYNSCFYATIETEKTTTAGSALNAVLCAYQACYYFDEATGAPADAYVLGVPNGTPHQWDGLLKTQSAAAVGGYVSTGNAPVLATGDVMIPVKIGATTYYLVALADTGV